jgi:DHA1 family purine ribonucleoside efflux pump-like MFS transporter
MSRPSSLSPEDLPATGPTRSNWRGIAALGLSVFALVMAEFLPAALLTPMAADLRISVAAGGQAVTATAAVGAFAALLTPVATRRWDRRSVALGLLGLLCISNLLTALARDLPTLLAGRGVLGVALGGFWSMATAIAMRIVPMPVLGKAMAIVFTGVTVATVSAAPLGAYVGDVWGWRASFGLAGLIGLVACASVALTLPRLPANASASLAGLVEVARRPAVATALVAVLLVISGHFAAFTYVRPVLEELTRLEGPAIAALLLGFGCAGFLGNILGGLLAQRDPRLAVAAGAALMALAMVAIVLFARAPVLASLALAVWGMAFAVLPVGFQAWVATAAPDRAELAGGLLTANFQVAIAGGAVLGGLLVDRFGVLAPDAYCAVGAAAGIILLAAQVVSRRRSPGT